MKCPKCGSINVTYTHYMGIECVICKSCGFSEEEELNLTPEYKTSQKQKGKYTPYKTGGSRRTQKK
jgi:phage FluMu protein Com